jgi:hypothetical protein
MEWDDGEKRRRDGEILEVERKKENGKGEMEEAIQ